MNLARQQGIAAEGAFQHCRPTKRWNAVNRQHLAKTGKFLFLISALMILAAGTLLISARTGQAQEATRILVVPFEVHAAGDLSYLQRGITDMLTSRLERNNKVVVISAKGTGDDDLAALARKTQADLVITGSVTILGDSVSTDAQVARAAAVDEPVLSFGQTGSQHADVIAHVNQLAATINERLLSRGTDQAKQPAAPAPSAAVPVPVGSQAVTPPNVPAPPSPPPSPATVQQAQPGGALEPMPLPGIGTIKGQLHCHGHRKPPVGLSFPG
jgi:TolB-like protein